ncbi:hypothetical protein LJB42_004046 [Komagataella kurtzmanii]|nr:hypothetical protein LJB42_004046 [Komagataella kurtzmanii]
MFKSHPTVALFDIRIQSPYKDTLLVSSLENDNQPTPLSGSLVFSLSEDIIVKSISLKLLGTFKLDFLEQLHDNNRLVATTAVKENGTVLEVDWANLLTSSDGSITSGDYGQKPKFRYAHPTDFLNDLLNDPHLPSNDFIGGRNNTRINFKKGQHINFPSCPPNTTPFDSSVQGCLFKLSQGNYALPFQVSLPANVPDTVEGLRSGSILYKLHGVLNVAKGKGISTYKYLRIFRTQLQSSLALSQECVLEDNWADKLQYQITLPSKGIPIAGQATVQILIIPFTKELKLGKIRISLEQYFWLQNSHAQIFGDSSVVFRKNIAVSTDDLGQDRWDILRTFDIPSNLKEITQSVEVRDNLLTVKHKLKICIELILDGVTSEVRASVPVTVYVSTSNDVTGRSIQVDKLGRFRIKPRKEIKLFGDAEFRKHDRPPNDQPPPVYDSHVYDPKLEGTAPASRSPILSRSLTPLGSPGMTDIVDSELEIYPLELDSCTSSLRFQDQTIDSNPPNYIRAVGSDSATPDLAPLYTGGLGPEELNEINNRLKEFGVATTSSSSNTTLSSRPKLLKTLSGNSFFRSKNFTGHTKPSSGHTSSTSINNLLKKK